MSKTSLDQQIVSGPNGEKLKINWMPGDRVRFDLIDCGKCAVTIIWAKTDVTNVEMSYKIGKK